MVERQKSERESTLPVSTATRPRHTRPQPCKHCAASVRKKICTDSSIYQVRRVPYLSAVVGTRDRYGSGPRRDRSSGGQWKWFRQRELKEAVANSSLLPWQHRSVPESRPSRLSCRNQAPRLSRAATIQVFAAQC